MTNYEYTCIIGMKTPSKTAEFWVTNGSPRNVTLADLALNIKAFTTVNLLDKRHYKYTLEQLNKSKESGSIYTKRAFIKVRDVPPPAPEKRKIPFVESAVIPTRQRSTYKIDDTEYNEITDQFKEEQKELEKKLDEQLASENVDLELGK